MSRSAFRNLVREARFLDFPLDQIRDFVRIVHTITANVFAGNTKDIRFAKILKYTERELFLDFLLKKLPYLREVGETEDKRHEFVLRVKQDSSDKFQQAACNAQEVLAGLGDWYAQLESKLRVVWLSGVEHKAAFSPSETLFDLKEWIGELHRSTGDEFMLATAMPTVVIHDLDQPLLLFDRQKLVCKPVGEVQIRQAVETQKQQDRGEATALRQAEFAKQHQEKLAAKAAVEHKRLATIQKFANDRPVAEAKARLEIRKHVTH